MVNNGDILIETKRLFWNILSDILVVLGGKYIDVILLFSKQFVPIDVNPGGKLTVVNVLFLNAEFPMDVINGGIITLVNDFPLKTPSAILVTGYFWPLVVTLIGINALVPVV